MPISGAAPTSGAAPAETRVYLVRHGVTDSNADGRLQGHRDIPLNDTGREQARGLGRWLQRIAPAAIFTSDLCRCVETAALAAGSSPASGPQPGHTPAALITPELRERCFGEWEGLTTAEIQERYPEMHQRWRRREPGFCPPGGESYQQLSGRAARFLERVVNEYPGKSVVVFSHGGTINACVAYALGGLGRSLPILFGNASISALHSVQGQWKIALLNGVCSDSGVSTLADGRPGQAAAGSGDQGPLLGPEPDTREAGTAGTFCSKTVEP